MIDINFYYSPAFSISILWLVIFTMVYAIFKADKKL